MSNFTVRKKEPYNVLLENEFNRKMVGERLVEARKSCGLSRENVADIESVGVHKNTLRAWETGEREASIEKIFVLASIYKTDPLQIISGNYQVNKSEYLYHDNEDGLLANPDYVQVLQYDLTASAGMGSYVVSENAVANFTFQKQWLASQGLHNKQLSILEVRGDSMESTLFDGDLMLVSLIDDPADAREGVCVLRYDDNIFVKRIQYDFPTRSYNVTSDNKRYNHFRVEEDDIISGRFSVVAKVERVVQRLSKPI